MPHDSGLDTRLGRPFSERQPTSRPGLPPGHQAVEPRAEQHPRAVRRGWRPAARAKHVSIPYARGVGKLGDAVTRAFEKLKDPNYQPVEPEMFELPPEPEEGEYHVIFLARRAGSVAATAPTSESDAAVPEP